MTSSEIKSELMAHPNVKNDSIEVLEDQITFRLINPLIPFPYMWKDHEVVFNDCEGFEDECAILK